MARVGRPAPVLANPRLESLSGAAPAAMDALDDDVNEENETDVLKLAHAIAGIDRDTIRY